MIHKILSILTLLILRLRYTIHVKGLENIDPRSKESPGGFLVLPNHPTYLIDPSLVICCFYKKAPLHPVVIDSRFYIPIVQSILSYFKVIPIPGFTNSINSYKLKKLNLVLNQIVKGLENNENFLIYPAGKTKTKSREEIRGISGIHTIINRCQHYNIILVRTTGLWGSSFSFANPEKPPFMGVNAIHGIKETLKNLIFFNPRREVTIEFVKAPRDFPFHASKNALNEWLENWYNRQGLFDDPKFINGEPLSLVPYSMWSKKTDHPIWSDKKKTQLIQEIDLALISSDVREKVLNKISELSNVAVNQLTPDMKLGYDLKLDSIEIVQLVAFLESEFDRQNLSGSSLDTVKTTLEIASGLITPSINDSESPKLPPFVKPIFTPVLKSRNLLEFFFEKEKLIPKTSLCGDELSGALTYHELKKKSILLADILLTLKEQTIGLLLPPTSSAVIFFMACLLAKKTLVMINWTKKPLDKPFVDLYLSTFSYIDSISNADFGNLDEKIVLIDDLIIHYPLIRKCQSLLRSNQSLSRLSQRYGQDIPRVFIEDQEIVMNEKHFFDRAQDFKQTYQISDQDLILVINPSFDHLKLAPLLFAPYLLDNPVYFYSNPNQYTKIIQFIKANGITVVFSSSKVINNLKQMISNQEINDKLKFEVN